MDLTSTALTTSSAGILRDATVPGLHAKVTATGKRFFLYYRTKGGVERRPKLGDFPRMTVAQARTIAKAMLLEVAAGKDPMAARAADKSAITVADALAKYGAVHAPRRKSGAASLKLLTDHLGKRLGARPIDSVRHLDMSELHAAMARTPVLANRIIAYASKLFTLCESWEWRARGTNPCVDVEDYPERKRKRYTSPEEIQKIVALLDASKDKQPGMVAYVYLLILTGARSGEVAAARWDWLDGNVLRLPDSKTGEKSIYLPPPAMEVINAMPRTSGTIVGVSCPHKFWYRIRAEAGCADLRLHDLRHSFASAALDAGLSLAQIGELLGHASTQTTKRYAHLVESAAHSAAARTAAIVAANMGR